MPERAQPNVPLWHTPISRASVQNRVLEATEFYQDQKKLGNAGNPPPFKPRDSGKLMVRNITGSTLAAGSCLQLGAFILNASTRFNDATLWLDGDTAAAPASARFAITKSILVDDGIGEAFASGVCVALVNVTDVDHTHATPVASATVMDSSVSGPCEILSPLTDTGTQDCIIRLGPSPVSIRQFAIVQTSPITGLANDTDWPDESAGTAKYAVFNPDDGGAVRGWLAVGDAFDVQNGSYKQPLFVGQLVEIFEDGSGTKIAMPLAGHESFRVVGGLYDPSFVSSPYHAWMEDETLALAGPGTDDGLTVNVNDGVFLVGFSAQVVIDGTAVATSAVDFLSCSIAGQQGQAETFIPWVLDDNAAVIGPDGVTITLSHVGLVYGLGATTVLTPTLYTAAALSGATYTIANAHLWGFQCGQGHLKELQA